MLPPETRIIAINACPARRLSPQHDLGREHAVLMRKRTCAADLHVHVFIRPGKARKNFVHQQLAPELWTITDENGQAAQTLEDGALYELRVTVADGGAFDLDEADRTIKASVVLGKKKNLKAKENPV